MDNLEQRCERLQSELDQAREVIRAAGYDGFGSLIEGLHLVLDRKPPQGCAVFVDDVELATISARCRSTRKILRVDDEARARLPLRMEALRLVLKSLADQRAISAQSLLDAVDAVDAQLTYLLREFELHQRREA